MNALSASAPLILQIGDDETDHALIQDTCAEGGLNASFVVAMDGVAAMRKIAELATEPQALLPDLILLDLDLPKRHGHGLLSFIRSHPVFDGTPVVILSGMPGTTMDDPSSFFSSTAHAAKPRDPAQARDLLRQLEECIGKRCAP